MAIRMRYLSGFVVLLYRLVKMWGEIPIDKSILDLANDRKLILDIILVNTLVGFIIRALSPWQLESSIIRRVEFLINVQCTDKVHPMCVCPSRKTPRRKIPFQHWTPQDSPLYYKGESRWVQCWNEGNLLSRRFPRWTAAHRCFCNFMYCTVIYVHRNSMLEK